MPLGVRFQMAIVLMITAQGCRFAVESVTVTAGDADVGDLPAAVDDLATASDLSAPDLATPADLSTSADLLPGPDLFDSCPKAGSDPSPPTLAARCVSDDAITIDGNLSEWTGAFVPLTHATAASASGTWSNNETSNDAVACIAVSAP